MKTRFLLVSVTFVSLCSGISSASADSSLRLYGLSDVIPFNTLHTHLSLKPNLSPQQVFNQSEIQVAQVCWIMDTGDCAGLDFVSSDINGSGNKPPSEYDKKGSEDCIKEGYKLTSCQSGYKGNKFCMYDNRYFAECVLDCPSDYKTCSAPYKGVGKACGDDLYAECCLESCPAEYKYTLDSIPKGYEADGEPCIQCEGTSYKAKYKITEKDCSGFLDCGKLGCEDGATTCQSGDTTLCSECKKCPNLGTESECPPCTVCTFEECSNLYAVTGCATGCTDWCDYCAFEQ